jgi:hypothetical protein
VFFSTSCKKQTFQVDDIILQCYDSKYQEEGYDIKTIIEDYEKLLVKEGILRDDSGKSYLQVYQKIASDKDFRIKSATFQEFDPWNKVDKQIGVAVFMCEYEMIELAKEKDSKWLRISPNYESPESVENPDQVYQAMVETLSENELNSYYFRLKMFHLFDMVNSKWGNQSLMPSVSTE